MTSRRLIICMLIRTDGRSGFPGGVGSRQLAVARSAELPLRTACCVLPTRIMFEVVIPARDEASTIAAVVRAARASRASRVLVVDDHSSDDTAAIARDAGAEV